MFTLNALCVLYSRKMILHSWKLLSSVCVKSLFGQAWNKWKPHKRVSQSKHCIWQRKRFKAKKQACKAAWVNIMWSIQISDQISNFRFQIQNFVPLIIQESWQSCTRIHFLTQTPLRGPFLRNFHPRDKAIAVCWQCRWFKCLSN